MEAAAAQGRSCHPAERRCRYALVRFEFSPAWEGAKGREIRSHLFGGSGRAARRVLSRVLPEYAGFGDARLQSGIFSERPPLRQRCGDIARAPARTAGGRSNRTAPGPTGRAAVDLFGFITIVG